MTRLKSIALLLLSAALLSSCGKDALQNITGTLPGSNIKFFNFGVNAPGVNFYAGNTKLTAISSTTGTESTIGTAYGQVGNGGLYAGIAPGQYMLSAKISATTDKNLAISTVPATLADGKHYSLYLSGFYDATAKTVDAFMIEDVFPDSIDFAVPMVRFVNAISNSSPMTLYLKLTSVNIEGPIGGDVAYKQATEFEKVPPGVYDLSTRVAGSSANVITRTAVSFLPGRVYTISAQGDITVVSTTATTRPQLDNTTNR